jgi:mannose-6-phosphate isomerase-like protein (cupin superfamily)
MIIVKDSEKKKHEHSSTVIVCEYEPSDPELGGATATIRGRYPERGFVVNLEVKQLAYVISGAGEVLFQEGTRALAQGDMVFIAANEKFAWNGDMELFLANAPRFEPKQYRETD